jgi:Tfp pilus assembly protein PilP
MRKAVAAGAIGLLLCSCGGDDGGDFKAGLEAKTADLRGQVHPLPRMRPAPQYRYEAGRLPDPFYPDRR